MKRVHARRMRGGAEGEVNKNICGGEGACEKKEGDY